jgi:L-fucose isomerase-like protein
VLRQLGHSFELVHGAPEAAATRRRFREAVQLAVTVRRLRTVRLGVVGGQAPGYFAMGADPFAIHHGLGVQMQTYSLIEFGNVLNELKDDAVAADVAAVKTLKLAHKDTTDDDLPMASKLYLTMRAFLETENLDALTIREWPEMPNVFGQWPYLGVARLAEEGRAIGIEGDADGALTAWIGENLGLGRCYLTDWLEHDQTTITTWHGGAAPFSLCEPPGTPGGPRLARHFNIKKPAAVEATIRAGMPVTLMRLWRCEGKYLVTAREGETLRPRRHLMMTNGLVRLDRQDPGEWFEELCHQGMPHHVALFCGKHEAFLRRFAGAIGAQFV